MSLRPPISRALRCLAPRSSCKLALLGLGLLQSLVARPARAEVPTPPDAQRGREFRVDFSARHLDVDAELGELSLSGDVVVTVGRYRLGGDRVRLQRGPRGISVEGGGDIAFCSCDRPPVTLGYSSVTIAPPSDVLIKHAVLRAGPVPLFWLPYLWLRSPDRLALIFPSAEWRGDDGLLLGSGLHIPFESNQGRPAARALDIGAFGYVNGGARLEARLLTPQSTSVVSWDHLNDSALTIDAHAAVSGEAPAIWAYDFDASRGARGRSSLSSLEAAARRYDHARVGVGSTGSVLFGAGLAADGVRGARLTEPLSLGPYAELSTSGSLGKSSSYAFDLGAASAFAAGEPRLGNGETRSIQRLSLESAQLLGPALARASAFEQGEVVSFPSQAVAKLRAGAGVAVSLPLIRRYTSLTHFVGPEILARLERQYWDDQAQNAFVATGGLATALGNGPRGNAARLRVAAGAAGDTQDAEPLVEATLSGDSRFLGIRVVGQAEPRTRQGEGSARVRLGARGGTTLVGYAEARTDEALADARLAAQGELLPRWNELGALDREGLTTGAELTLALGPAVTLGGGVDADPLESELLGVRSFARYRHPCGCFAVAGMGSARQGRGGLDASLHVDLMP
jgi:hypothetical protein